MTIIKYNKDKNSITFLNEKNEEIEREIIKKFNMEVISYKNSYYFYTWMLDIYEEKKLIKITEDMMLLYQEVQPIEWNTFTLLLEKIYNKFSYLQTEDKWETYQETRSFDILKSGNIKLLKEPKKVGNTIYKEGTYIHRGIQIGTNISFSEDFAKFIYLIAFLLLVFDRELTYKNTKKPTTAKFIKENSFYTFGIG